jgi:hypothetical protein
MLTVASTHLQSCRMQDGTRIRGVRQHAHVAGLAWSLPIKQEAPPAGGVSLPDLLSPPDVFARAFQRMADLIAGKRQ